MKQDNSLEEAIHWIQEGSKYIAAIFNAGKQTDKK
jgi:hypothetical protein